MPAKYAAAAVPEIYDGVEGLRKGAPAMREREFYLSSSDGTSKLHCIEWIPDGQVHAVLQISHGMVEHIGRYREFAAYLAERGIAVYGHDHLGHGKTSVPEDLGYFGDRDGAVHVVQDIRRLTIYGKKRFHGVKHFLLGHSMGSFFVRHYLNVYEDGPDGVILLGTGGQASPFIAFGYGLSKLICKLKGPRHRSKSLFVISTGKYSRAFRPAVTKCDWLTRDVERARKYEQDELCHFFFTAGAYRDFFELILKTSKLEKLGVIRDDMSLLFLSGDRDPVGENSHGVRRVYKRYAATEIEDLMIGFYADARHEILNEINREEVYSDIHNWITDRL